MGSNHVDSQGDIEDMVKLVHILGHKKLSNMHHPNGREPILLASE